MGCGGAFLKMVQVRKGMRCTLILLYSEYGLRQLLLVVVLHGVTLLSSYVYTSDGRNKANRGGVKPSESWTKSYELSVTGRTGQKHGKTGIFR